MRIVPGPCLPFPPSGTAQKASLVGVSELVAAEATTTEHKRKNAVTRDMALKRLKVRHKLASGSEIKFTARDRANFPTLLLYVGK
jgi:hypothetical protein